MIRSRQQLAAIHAALRARGFVFDTHARKIIFNPKNTPRRVEAALNRLGIQMPTVEGGATPPARVQKRGPGPLTREAKAKFDAIAKKNKQHQIRQQREQREMAARQEARATRDRERMVEDQPVRRGIVDARVLDAMRKVDQEYLAKVNAQRPPTPPLAKPKTPQEAIRDALKPMVAESKAGPPPRVANPEEKAEGEATQFERVRAAMQETILAAEKRAAPKKPVTPQEAIRDALKPIVAESEAKKEASQPKSPAITPRPPRFEGDEVNVLPEMQDLGTTKFEVQADTKKILGGGIMESLFTHIDGDGNGILKPARGERRVSKDIPVGTYYKREAASYVIAKILGMDDLVLPTAVTQHKNGPAVIRPIAFEGNGKNAYKDSAVYDELVADRATHSRVAMFDVMIGNIDRHKGNLVGVAGQNQWKLIDNGLILPESGRGPRVGFDAHVGVIRSDDAIPKELKQHVISKTKDVIESLIAMGFNKKVTLGVLSRIEHIVHSGSWNDLFRKINNENNEWAIKHGF